MTDHPERRRNDEMEQRYEEILRQVTAKHEALTAQTLNHIDDRMELHIKPLTVVLENLARLAENHEKAIVGNGTPGCKTILATLMKSVEGLLKREEDRRLEMRDMRVALGGGFGVGLLLWLWSRFVGS